jgi:hypothetical protein
METVLLRSDRFRHEAELDRALLEAAVVAVAPPGEATA